MAKFIIMERCRFKHPKEEKSRHWDRGESLELDLDSKEHCVLALELTRLSRICFADDPKFASHLAAAVADLKDLRARQAQKPKPKGPGVPGEYRPLGEHPQQ